MGSGRGDRNQELTGRGYPDLRLASMGSGRGDRNQGTVRGYAAPEVNTLQWGPVVVTGIRSQREEQLMSSYSFNGVRSW